MRLFVFTVKLNGISVVLSVEFITELPFTCRLAWSTEAESVGTKSAEASFELKPNPRKEAKKPAPNTKIFFHKNNLKECDFWPCIYNYFTISTKKRISSYYF